MNQLKLSNGLSILLHNMPNTHSVTLGLYIRVGTGNEDVPGITHLLEHLHFRRLGTLTQDDLYYKMECMGTTLRASTYRDFLKFTLKITPNHFEDGVEIFKNLIETITWSDEEFEKEKQVVVNQIIEQGDYVSIEKEVQKQIFGKHPFGREIMGSKADVELLTKLDLVAYKKRIFTSENMLFCVTGNLTDLNCEHMMQVMQTVPVYMNSIQEQAAIPKDFHHRKPDVIFHEVQDENPLDVNLSFDITYDKHTKDLLTILNCILGEGVGSRLQKRIRETKCYTSDIFSYVEWYRKFAVLHIRFSVEKTRLDECVNEIINVLNELKSGIQKKDLDVTLPFYTTNHVFYEDDTEEMNFQLAYNEFILGTGYQRVTLENNESTIRKIQSLASGLFVEKKYVHCIGWKYESVN